MCSYETYCIITVGQKYLLIKHIHQGPILIENNGGQTTTVVYVLTQTLGQVDLTEIGSQNWLFFLAGLVPSSSPHNKTMSKQTAGQI